MHGWGRRGTMRESAHLRRGLRPSGRDVCSCAYLSTCLAGEGELYLRPGRATTTCPECGHETDAAEQVEWIGEQFEQRLMTPTELASALKVLGDPVPMGTIKSWISRERLPEVTDGLYRVSDAQKLALARKTRGKVSA